jgi:peptidoglycan-associated lipoprotein
MKSHYILVLCLITAIVACKPSAPAAPPSEPSETPAAPEPAPAPAPAPAADPGDVHIVGDHLEIDRFIHFAFDSHQILEDSFDLLDHIAQLLKNHPEIVELHVIGHTDSAGTREYNQRLSERRANAVVEALRTRGVTQTMDAAGKGMTQHLCTEETDACHEKNRRVEFVIEKR